MVTVETTPGQLSASLLTSQEATGRAEAFSVGTLLHCTQPPAHIAIHQQGKHHFLEFVIS